MTDKENYPGKWMGQVPESIKSVAMGKAQLNVNLSICLPYMEHLAYPVYKPLEGLKVLDPACGTGEVLLLMAAKYSQMLFTASDISAEALATAQQYAEDLGLKNVSFLNTLPEQGDYDFIITTRPLQQIDDLSGFLAILHKNLGQEGLLRIQSFTGSHPEENLYLQERVAEIKAGGQTPEEIQSLAKELLAQPLKDHIDGLRECNQVLERTGLGFISGLHPRSYEPGSYLPPMDLSWLNGFSLLDRAYLAEQFCGQMLMHSLLYSHLSYHPEMPSMSDSQASKYIPYLSPYALFDKQEERVIVGLKHQHLLLEAGIEFEDLSIPGELLRVLQAVDGKLNFEQIHRRFLPMPWERFWTLMKAGWEEEIIYLHRA